jgi:hexosaminidase
VSVLKITFDSINDKLLSGTLELKEILGIEIGDGGVPVKVIQNGNGISVKSENGMGTISYSKKSEFYRGLGLFVEQSAHFPRFVIDQKPVFKELGVMCDNSRNAVMRVETIKKMIRHQALMGYTFLMLYTEDTYQIENYPYFGYMRGRFTADEIKACDQYAQMMGIELIPCIQTLAHLGAALRWNTFDDVADSESVLLTDNDHTYELIDEMLNSLSEMYTSRKINIGMDEAEMIGMGKYLQQHGYEDRFEIMSRHLKKILKLCNKYGFKPMMWSDMFFKLLSKGYNHGDGIDQNLIKQVPKDVSLIYWDYYSENSVDYDRTLERHLQFNNQIVFAGGAWTAANFAPCNKFSFKTGKLALESCRKYKIEQVFTTMWGDNGGECAFFSTLPVLQLFAEYCYTGCTSDEHIRTRLATCAKANFDDFMNLDMPNLLPGNEESRLGLNPSKYLLYQDLLCGLFDRHVRIGAYNNYFLKTAETLKTAAANNPDWSYLFIALSDLCDALVLKCDMGLRLYEAYHEKNIAELKKLSGSLLPELLGRVETLHRSFKNEWTAEKKIIGFDVQDIRFGALKERIKTAKTQIDDFCSGKIVTIEELEEEKLYYIDREGIDRNPHVREKLWHRIVSANNIE